MVHLDYRKWQEVMYTIGEKVQVNNPLCWTMWGEVIGIGRTNINDEPSIWICYDKFDFINNLRKITKFKRKEVLKQFGLEKEPTEDVVWRIQCISK